MPIACKGIVRFIVFGSCTIWVRSYLLKILIYEERIFSLESEAEPEILECHHDGITFFSGSNYELQVMSSSKEAVMNAWPFQYDC